MEQAPIENEGEMNGTEEVRPRGEYGYEDPRSGAMHFFKTEAERADFLAEQNENKG